MIKIIVFLHGKLCIAILLAGFVFINLILIFLPVVIENFAARVQVGQVGGLEKEILGITACIENCEHLKYFRNVGCVLTNHNKDDET